MEKKTKQFYEQLEQAICDFNDTIDSGIAEEETRKGKVGRDTEIHKALMHIRETEKLVRSIKKREERKEARKTYNRTNKAFTAYTIAEFTVAILYKIFRRK